MRQFEHSQQSLFDAAKSRLSGEFRDYYDQFSKQVITPAAESKGVTTAAQVVGALQLLAERFSAPGNDGPTAYANFLADPEDEEEKARLRNEAVAAVNQFLGALG